MSDPDRGAGEDEHEVDCDCIYCQLDHMQERADQRNDERIDREMEEEK